MLPFSLCASAWDGSWPVGPRKSVPNVGQFMREIPSRPNNLPRSDTDRAEHRLIQRRRVLTKLGAQKRSSRRSDQQTPSIDPLITAGNQTRPTTWATTKTRPDDRLGEEGLKRGRSRPPPTPLPLARSSRVSARRVQVRGSRLKRWRSVAGRCGRSGSCGSGGCAQYSRYQCRARAIDSLSMARRRGGWDPSAE